jgi:integrase
MLMKNGTNPKIVQERLGHSNINTTMDIYSHVTPTMQQEAVSNLVETWEESKTILSIGGGK